jgi:putative PIG3 family NAD(P)H quinone oxidoreductase
MRAIVIEEPGEPGVLRWSEVEDPPLAPDEVMLEVAAAGVNRADLLQRKGGYPPPAGAPPYPGLEAAGRIRAVGSAVTGWQLGDTACALLSGGGYAEQVAVPAGQLLPIPEGVSLTAAAALPEVACTVHANVFMLAKLAAGETFLVHGGAGGIGTMAIQIVAARGGRVLCTAGSAQKIARCHDLGADVAINYREHDFVTIAKEVTEGRGVDVLLDHMGASYLSRNVDALATGGRLVVIGLQGGRQAPLDLAILQAKRAAVHATRLRGRSRADKAAIVADVRRQVWPLIASGAVRPVIDRVIPMADAAEAHRVLEASEHFGKVVLTT